MFDKSYCDRSYCYSQFNILMIAVQEMVMRMYWLVIEYDDDSRCQGKVYSA
jgi:hypothetical protein